MTLQERLAQTTGVWEGTYTHLKPDGTVLDHYASRQETRLEGNHWYERVIYRWPAQAGEPPREQTLDFRASFDATGEQMLFNDPDFFGQTFLITDDIFVFPYHWKNRPGQRVVETIVFSSATQKSRLWQSFDHGELVKITVIREHRVDEQPVVWY